MTHKAFTSLLTNCFPSISYPSLLAIAIPAIFINLLVLIGVLLKQIRPKLAGEVKKLI